MYVGISRLEDCATAESEDRVTPLLQLLQEHHRFLSHLVLHASMFPIGLREDKQVLDMLRNGILRLGDKCINPILDTSDFPLICRVQSYVSEFARWWPEFGDIWKEHSASITAAYGG